MAGLVEAPVVWSVKVAGAWVAFVAGAVTGNGEAPAVWLVGAAAGFCVPLVAGAVLGLVAVPPVWLVAGAALLWVVFVAGTVTGGVKAPAFEFVGAEAAGTCVPFVAGVFVDVAGAAAAEQRPQVWAQ